jgi:hypothetical protein
MATAKKPAGKKAARPRAPLHDGEIKQESAERFTKFGYELEILPVPQVRSRSDALDALDEVRAWLDVAERVQLALDVALGEDPVESLTPLSDLAHRITYEANNLIGALTRALREGIYTVPLDESNPEDAALLLNAARALLRYDADAQEVQRLLQRLEQLIARQQTEEAHP